MLIDFLHKASSSEGWQQVCVGVTLNILPYQDNFREARILFRDKQVGDSQLTVETIFSASWSL